MAETTWHNNDHLALYRDLCLPCSTTVFCPYVSQVFREAVSQRIWRSMFMETRSWEQLLWENEGRKCSGNCQEELAFVVKHLAARSIPWAECFSEAVFRLEVSSEPSSTKQQAAMGGGGGLCSGDENFTFRRWSLSRAIFFHFCTCREKECIFS